MGITTTSIFCITGLFFHIYSSQAKSPMEKFMDSHSRSFARRCNYPINSIKANRIVVINKQVHLLRKTKYLNGLKKHSTSNIMQIYNCGGIFLKMSTWGPPKKQSITYNHGHHMLTQNANVTRQRVIEKLTPSVEFS